MNANVTLLLDLAMGLNLVSLGCSRLQTLIRVMALQGVVLGIMPLLMEHDLDWRVVLIALATVFGKGVVIPTLLRRAMRKAHTDRETEPFIGFVPSLLLGAGGTIAALTVVHVLPLLPEHSGSLLVPAAMATILTGFILLIGRAKAISQACGYLILENGIYLFGLLLLKAMPMLVEAGVLLDITVSVFIISIVVDRIQTVFDSLDTRHLTTLRE